MGYDLRSACEADLAVSGFSVSAERAEVSDYTVGFYYDDVILMTTFPDATPAGWTFYVKPFHWQVYLLLGCCFLLMTVVLSIMDIHFVRANARFPSTREKKTGLAFIASWAWKAFEALLGGLIGRAVAHEAVSRGGRVLLWAWMLMCLVTVAAYTGKLTSNSVVTKQPVPFNSLSELVQRTDYRWGIIKGTQQEYTFATSNLSDYQLYYERAERTGEEPVSELLAGNFVQVTSAVFYRVQKRKHCRMTVVKERLSQDTFAIHLQKDSPYTALFNHVLARATEQGLLDYLKREWFPQESSCQDSENRVMPVSVELVKTAFIMAALGVLVAAVVLMLERLLTRRFLREAGRTEL
ncbi:glutamate receptor ionotropic, kainate 4-like [Littorina saxatilis]|uniref:glutamate receptor ionotropic, kainate 4-like n=1 Tax=Littorina saxatilis TaxID=31220 RepID=UPI0038B45DCC